jgi:DNA-binding MarR family transcriptional regulator
MMDSGGDISEKVLIALRQIIRAIDLHSRYLAKHYGLTWPQLLILKELSYSKETTVGEVAHKLSLSQATVTSILDRLEKLQYVKRKRSNLDKRKVIVRITSSGIEKLKVNPTSLQDYFIREFNRLKDWEQTLLLSSIQRVASMMNADNIEVKPVLTVPVSTENLFDLPSEKG